MNFIQICWASQYSSFFLQSNSVTDEKKNGEDQCNKYIGRYLIDIYVYWRQNEWKQNGKFIRNKQKWNLLFTFEFWVSTGYTVYVCVCAQLFAMPIGQPFSYWSITFIEFYWLLMQTHVLFSIRSGQRLCHSTLINQYYVLVLLMYLTCSKHNFGQICFSLSLSLILCVV